MPDASTELETGYHKLATPKIFPFSKRFNKAVIPFKQLNFIFSVILRPLYTL